MFESTIRLRRPITVSVATLFVALGIWLLFDPTAVEGLYDLRLDSPMAKSEMRAIFGGMMIGVGASVLLLDLWVKRHRDAAMVLATVTAALVLSRIVGVAYEGIPTGPVLNETVFEVVLLIVLIATGAFRREA